MRDTPLPPSFTNNLYSHPKDEDKGAFFQYVIYNRIQ
jgi:hypothetical protein